MRHSIGDLLGRISALRKSDRAQNALAVILVILGPTLVGLTYLGLSVLDLSASSAWLRLILLIDLIYVLAIVTLIGWQILRIFKQRRRESAGFRLHSRLSATFAFMALVPTVIVAVFATVTLNMGLEGWFSERVQNVVGNSLSAAEAYEAEQSQDLIIDLRLMANTIANEKRRQGGRVFDGELVELLGAIQPQIQRGLKEAYIIDGLGNLRARGPRSYRFDYEMPEPAEIEEARQSPVIIKDWTNDEFRGLLLIGGFNDRYLYISRAVDGDLLTLLDDTKETVGFYQQMEENRGRVLFELALLYLGFAVIVILAATWLGLIFAERLARPVGQLVGAATRVGEGDFSVRVEEETSDDEIAVLGRAFNDMTRQVERQRDDLVDAHAETDARRRLFDSVLSGVTAGVIGVAPDGRIEVLNAAARALLGFQRKNAEDKPLIEAVPEFRTLFEAVSEHGKAIAQEEISLTRGGQAETLIVRVARRETLEGGLEGYVVTFDDVTDLMSAQRMAAWGDVARRIAHEIKNPLTPIQLSAERLKRKFRSKVGDEADQLDQYSDVIIRQTNDLRRIVDEFSKFARMPEAQKAVHDVAELLRDAVKFQQTALSEIEITLTGAKQPLPLQMDDTMIRQAVTNLIKNAGEAVMSRLADHPDGKGQIRIRLARGEGAATITIEDNGIGLPKEKRSRLFEPYVTHREGGTGLGLPIVKKIAEEHGGSLDLLDAAKFKGETHAGAKAVLTLPLTETNNNKEPIRSNVA